MLSKYVQTGKSIIDVDEVRFLTNITLYAQYLFVQCHRT